eukprot:COSAG03_NODE_27896_length_246_cov_22.986395_1_plen_81_part_11
MAPDDFHHVLPWQNLLHAGQENLFSGLTALTAEFTVGEGKLMTHDEPCSMAPDDFHHVLPWQNLLHAGQENLFSGLTALTA